MAGPAPAVAATRVAVRRTLCDLTTEGAQPGSCVLAAVSGGADSLALAAALAFEAPRAGLRGGAVIVDHGLQPGSDEVAARAATQCREMGLDPVEVVRVEVGPQGSGGPEARARDARHAALHSGAKRHEAVAVLLGHTRDDQAEQVLLGLARGSGARSLSGMPAARGLLRRPLLDVPRDVTVRACADQDLRTWEDPHNSDRRYRRVRARAALADLEADLGPGIAAALARSADLLRQDADTLDALATEACAALGDGPWPVPALMTHPAGVRRRVWRLLVARSGCLVADVSAEHVAALDALLTAWRGQGGVALPGGFVASRAGTGESALVHIDPAAR